MENTQELNRKIANNLIRYRKAAGWTQAELAEKINYSDKSVSKWESGNGIPDVYTLMQLASLYGVTLNDFVGDETSVELPQKKTKGLHFLIMLLSSGIVWLVATCIFVIIRLFHPNGEEWLSFIYAIPVNAILLIVYAGVWKYRLLNFVSVTTLIWTVLTCVFLTARAVSIYLGTTYNGLWTVFLVGVPLQVLEILWVFFRSIFKKNKERRAKLQNLNVGEETQPIEETEEETLNTQEGK